MEFEGGGALNGLALCAGYGGLELGIERVFDEYRTVCYVEGEAFAASHLIKKMEEGRMDNAPIWSNVKSFEGERWRGKVDIISGGFPCQPYSTAGKQMGEDDPRDLWPDFVRIIGEVRPGFLFLENVPNVVKLRLDQIILDLDKLGYSCSWGNLAASQVGAKHKRNRWFLFGVRNTNNNGLMEYANEESSEGVTKEGKLERNRLENISPTHSNANNSSKCSSEGSILEKRRNDSNRLCQDVSHTNSKRTQRIRRFDGKTQKIEPGKRFTNQSDKWNGKFESWWEVEPSMGRLVDGASDWVDKLRLLGNGVVPQQAAYALQILGERLACGVVENRTPKD
jgi:DNA (cytosine-5)-methyltransferase 1